jgi:hypothetical protein
MILKKRNRCRHIGISKEKKKKVVLTVGSVGISKHDIGIDICQAHAMHASPCSTRRIIAAVAANRNDWRASEATNYRIVLFKTVWADCPGNMRWSCIRPSAHGTSPDQHLQETPAPGHLLVKPLRGDPISRLLTPASKKRLRLAIFLWLQVNLPLMRLLVGVSWRVVLRE